MTFFFRPTTASAMKSDALDVHSIVRAASLRTRSTNLRIDGSMHNVSVARRAMGLDIPAHDRHGGVAHVTVRMRIDTQSQADAGTSDLRPILLFTTLTHRLERHDSFADLDGESAVFPLETSVNAVFIGHRRSDRAFSLTSPEWPPRNEMGAPRRLARVNPTVALGKRHRFMNRMRRVPTGRMKR